MSANLILGSSHALMLAKAVGDYQADWQQASRGLVPVPTSNGVETHLLFSTNRPTFLEMKRGPGGGIVGEFGPLMDEVRRFDRPDATVVLGLGGNEHNIRFLTAHPQPFDFLHPAWPGVEPGRQIIPAHEMVAVMQGLLERSLVVTRLIAAELPNARKWCLAPPPPIPSEAHIRANNENYFQFGTGVEAASVRLKIHAVYIEIMRRFCEENGLQLIPPAPGGQDEHGFLREPFWEGCTHAKADYYRPIVADLGL